MSNLNQLAEQINTFVHEIGFGNTDIPTRIALIHSEISEAFEAYRKDNYCPGTFTPFSKEMFEANVKDTFEDEIADSIIRLLDLCGELKIDIGWHIDNKMKYNATRGFKFGGKKF